MSFNYIYAAAFLFAVFLFPKQGFAYDFNYHPNFGVDIYLYDTDNDGLSDHEERAVYQTDWKNTDTDGDGYDDYTEVKNGFSPKHANLRLDDVDTDNDGLVDEWEIKLGTNLMVRDTDGDGYLDGEEMFEGYSPIRTSKELVDKKIVINVENNSLSYFFDGVALKEQIPVSTGKTYTLTPEGEFKILARVPVKHYAGPGYDYPNTKWNLHFTTDYYRYYIHGAYWHNQFGISGVSGGCVNVRYEDMELLYSFASLGTKVSIH